MKNSEIIETCIRAKRATKKLLVANTDLKNSLLKNMAEVISEKADEIKDANLIDLKNARAAGLSEAMIDRLTIGDETIKQMQQALAEVANLPDPLNIKTQSITRPNGIEVYKKKIPLGVILMIYESRPNVTVEAASLAIKSGNGIILRGGKEAFESNQAIANCWQTALQNVGLPIDLVTVLSTTDRSVLSQLLKLDELIDVVIPRGGEGLIRHVVENSRIPVIKHYKGVCHLYVDEFADFNKAIDILVNGKTQRPGVCNALEGLLVHESIADRFLPKAVDALAVRQVEIVGCDKSRALVSSVLPASEVDFDTEFLSLKISCKLVTDVEDAFEFIDQFGSGHTEVIITEDKSNADYFVNRVDASVVMVNASSRFSDGGELGLGAEIGISTSKIHAYGPMGLESLTSEKFVVLGEGQIRE